ncbi:MAG: inositol monophosphatase [Gammaproteobacteria bacterium]|nr:inositol monophosphatase [Gammaproteobacteria bacterium]
MESYLTVAIAAAQKAGEVIQDGAKHVGCLNVEQKSLNDFVSEIDLKAEKTIREYLTNHFPDHRILGEEYGVSQKSSNYEWVVDPLDGTTNFLRGIPHYAVSIALLVNDRVNVAVIFDPAKNDLFTAISGQGAFLNGTRIKIRSHGSIVGGLLATGVPFSGRQLERVDQFSEAMIGLLRQQTAGIRRLGAAALDLAYLAAGRYDGFWEANLQKWDIAAGCLLVVEAGGCVCDFNGKQNYLTSGNILAGSAAAVEEMLPVIKSAYKSEDF